MKSFSKSTLNVLIAGIFIGSICSMILLGILSVGSSTISFETTPSESDYKKLRSEYSLSWDSDECLYQNCNRIADYKLEIIRDISASMSEMNKRFSFSVFHNSRGYWFVAYFCDEHYEAGKKQYQAEYNKIYKEYVNNPTGIIIVFTLLGPVLIGVCIIIIIIAKRIDAKNAIIAKNAINAEMKKYGGFTLEQAIIYYRACSGSGIKDIESSANKQRALLLAKSRSAFNIENIDNIYIKMFETGQKSVVDAADAYRAIQTADKISKLRSEEEQQMQREKTIASLTKRDKRIYILKELINQTIKRISILEEGQKAALLLGVVITEATKEKERGWGVAAGLASGIANSAIGAAVALDIMTENRAIRERNEIRKQTYTAATAQDFFQSMDNIDNARKFEKRLLADIERANIKLVDESHDVKELFDSFEIENISNISSESGAITFNVIIAATKEFHMEDVKKAVIDGSLKANVLMDNKVVGQAYLTLPLNGIGTGEEAELIGICTSTEAGGNYTFKIEPHLLWVMEL
jgi:hypothetical protein